MKPAFCLLPFLAVVVFFLIRAEILGIRRQIYVLKPASTLIVIGAVVLSFAESARNPVYTAGVLLGLLLSFGGDVALMFPENKKAFTAGLGLFLLAHLAYAAAFHLLGRPSAWDGLSAMLLLILGAGFYGMIRKNLGAMRIPVIVYMLVISLMVNRSITVLQSPAFSEAQAGMVVVGAALFYVSDLILAASRFWRPWRCNRVSLAFYYAGQFLFALTASSFV
ncbi:MAG: lysoplasmalogenase [Anaerolineales bacterium]|nr:lysoplasmalogenase [Anaerolineales bacterium]